MIELSLLGLHALRGPDGRELGTLPAQPKRFALLAFLAIGATGGYHRRDSLAAMFWPDLDQFASRRALRNTLYHLRDALGDGVIVAQGDDAVAIDPTRLTCDVTRLREAVESGRYEEAVDLYRGELLAGMHFANAGEAFEEWLSRERATCSGDGDAGAPGAGRARGESGELGGGRDVGPAGVRARPGRRELASARHVTPRPEQRHRRRSPAARGVRSAASRRVQRGAERRDGVARGPNQGRGRRRGRATPAGNAPGSGSTARDRSGPWPQPSTIGPEPSARRRRIAITAAAIGTAAIAIVLAVRATSATHSRVATARQRVLVEVFDNRTGDAGVQSLGRMAQDWIAQGLLRTELVEVVDPRAVYVQTHLVGGGAADPATLARHTGATVLVSGSYFRTGDTLFFDAAVTNAQTGRIAGVVGPILSSARNPVAGLDELRSRVMSAVATAVEVRATMDIRGPGGPAIRRLPRLRRRVGCILARRWTFRRKTLFLRSARGDTLFTPAVLAAAMTGSNRNHCTLSDSLARVLASRSRPLDRKDRLTLQVIDARCRGRNEEMLRLTLERAKLDPSTPGNLTVAAAAANWANRPGMQLELLQRVNPAVDLAWSTDSTHVAYWSGFTSALHSLGRHREELAVTDRMTPGAPLTRILLRATALAAMSRPTAALALLDSGLTLPVETANDIGLAPYTDGRPEYTTTPAWIAWWVGCELAVHGDSVAARQAAQRAVAWYRSRPAEERATFEERLVAAWSLDLAGARVEAEAIARQLLEDSTTNVDVQAELAGLAAERGDVARADSIDRWLAAQPVSRVNWSALIYRARDRGASRPARQRGDAYTRSARRRRVARMDPPRARVRPPAAPAGFRRADRTQRLSRDI